MAAVMTRLILLVGLVLSAICASDGLSQPAKADDSLCGDPASGNFWQGTAKPKECQLLRQFPDIARRDGNRLVIELISGQSRIFADKGECWVSVSCTFYVLGSIGPDGDVVGLWVGAAEGGDALLFDRRSGEEIGVGELPEISSDGHYWIVIDSSLLEGSGLAQLIEHEGGRFNVVAEGNGEFCNFERWEIAPTFLAICYDQEKERRMEFRFAPDTHKELARAPTGRALTPEEEKF